MAMCNTLQENIFIFWRKKYSSEISEKFLTDFEKYKILPFVGNILGISDELSFIKNKRQNTDDSQGRLHDLGYRFGVYVFVGNSSEISDGFPTKWKISVGNSSEMSDEILTNFFLENCRRNSDGLRNFRSIFDTNFQRIFDDHEFRYEIFKINVHPDILSDKYDVD